MLQGNVLITGGAGFLGRGIMRKAIRESWACKFFVVSRDEMKHQRASTKYPADYIVCDVLDTVRLSLVMRGMDYVIHAAAAKHIPVCERYPSDAIRVNVDGTRSVIEAAYAANVKRVILISTDKACEPINAYGATKMLVERMVFESLTLGHPRTELVGCRYGNIIGSTGSVWSVFQEQRDRDGYLSVTNPKMTRYFWGVDNAVDLIEFASETPIQGTVAIPTLRSILMHDMAVYLTSLWKLEPYKIIGERPGEKLHETLVSPNEAHRTASYGECLLLHGPTLSVESERRLKGPVLSELADTLSMDEFLAIAEDSESV